MLFVREMPTTLAGTSRFEAKRLGLRTALRRRRFRIRRLFTVGHEVEGDPVSVWKRGKTTDEAKKAYSLCIKTGMCMTLLQSWEAMSAIIWKNIRMRIRMTDSVSSEARAKVIR